MAHTRQRSWSHSRSTLLAECPRAAWYAYYSGGEAHEAEARLLRRAATPATLAGTIVHEVAAATLHQISQGGRPAGLAALGAARYDSAVEASRRAAGRTASSRTFSGVPILLHHLSGGEDPVSEMRGRDAVHGALVAFEGGRALAVLRATDPRGWHIPQGDVPWWETRGEMGFAAAVGLRCYGAYDLIAHVGDDRIILDWKTGSRTPRSEAATRRQLAGYALAAIADGVRPDRVRVLACWMAEDAPWAPLALDEPELRAAVERIEHDHALESALVEPIADCDGVVVRHEAREPFEARPEAGRCRWCRYAGLCEHGGSGMRETPVR